VVDVVHRIAVEHTPKGVVRCATAETLARYTSGYEPDADDWHDVSLLNERFGVPIPAGYERRAEPPG
jgi:hypothetical protein